ncbi:monovalent cation/H(+) antiporter subunit G [Canibacter zhoujuaniae]|uniref:monovalent cation/H(+) antiporter subunit G n=1 Tax=Canibacter zhoujuaniae TaxID=2708343 RepID=UPI00141E7D47|nr:monovalent cation/H(+) antiporter subunit G [Canibacter zhoujuaniae]
MLESPIWEIAAAVCVLGAGLLSATAGIGLLRFKDPLSRLHAATKPQIFGLLLIILAVALDQRNLMTLFALLPVFILQSLTAPVSAHMAGRAAYRAGHIDREHLALDELEPVIQRANTDVEDPRRIDISAEEGWSIKNT